MSIQVAFLRRDAETAGACMRILGLPDLAWTQVDVTFGTSEPAAARVEFLLRPDQIVALAELAAQGALSENDVTSSNQEEPE